MPHFEVTWRVIDAGRGRFVGGVINRMKDPGPVLVTVIS